MESNFGEFAAKADFDEDREPWPGRRRSFRQAARHYLLALGPGINYARKAATSPNGCDLMKPRTVRRSLLVLAGAPLALLVLGWLAPGSARATCGDYVVMGKSAGHATTDGQTAAHDFGGEKPAPSPCTGPLCSRRAPLPVVPPAPPPTS